MITDSIREGRGIVDFRHLEIKTKYKSLNDDVLSDFYIPVLANSIEYKRAVGYFSSKNINRLY